MACFCSPLLSSHRTGGSAQKAAGAAPAPGGFDLSDLDTTCKPCEDFFQFATGGWVAHNPIEPAYPSWGRFNALQEKNQDVLRQIVEAAAKAKSAPGSIEQKIGDFYASCMDQNRIEAAGVKPLQPEFARIAALSSLSQLQGELARLQSQGIGAFFYFGSGQDDKDSSQVIGIATQGGLGLPDRDYYTTDDDKSKQLREQYVQHVGKMFQLAGDPPDVSVAEARTVMTIETQMAQASKTRVEQRVAESNYHRMGPAELLALTPDFSWPSYFRNIGFPDIRAVNVGQPEFFQALDKQLVAVSLSDWKTYLRWNVLHFSARALPSKFVDEDFDFYGRTLTGAKELQPRWRRCVAVTDNALGEALGQKYVARAFPPEAKARAYEMVQNLDGGPARGHCHLAVDGRPDAPAGLRQALRDDSEDRLPRQVA